MCPHAAIIGVKLHTLLKGTDGFRGILQQQIGLGLHGGNTGILAPACRHRVEVAQGTLIVLLLDATQRTVVPKALSLRIVAQGGVIVADGIVEVLLLNTAETAQLVAAYDIGVALDGLRAVAFGSCIVIKIIFGHSPVEPRFVEIGFGIDSLIEILDAQHIVFVIECRAANHHQSVGVELGF